MAWSLHLLDSASFKKAGRLEDADSVGVWFHFLAAGMFVCQSLTQVMVLGMIQNVCLSYLSVLATAVWVFIYHIIN